MYPLSALFEVYKNIEEGSKAIMKRMKLTWWDTWFLKIIQLYDQLPEQPTPC